MGFKLCVNPLRLHGNAILFKTRSISTLFRTKCDTVLGQVSVSEGQQLCDRCYSEIRHQYDLLQINESIASGEIDVTINLGEDESTYVDSNVDIASTAMNTRTLRSGNIRSQSTAVTAATAATTQTISIDDAQFHFDSCLRSLELPPLQNGLSNTQKKAEFVDKCLNIVEKVKQIMECLYPQSSSVIPSAKCTDCATLTNDVKEKYGKVKTKEERFKLATCLPRSMSINEMISTLNVSRDIAKKISKLRNENGAFSFVDRAQRKISDETIQKVKQYYLSPLYSKIMPGQHDTVFSDKDADGNKQRVAKQQMLVTLTELHSEFVQQNPDNTISLSEFAKIRPRQCCWVWNKGQHRNCTCIIHENFKMLLQSTCTFKAGQRTEQVIGSLLCEGATMNCWMGLCDSCPIEEKVGNLLVGLDNDDEITFYQWVSTDRTDLLKLTETTTDFCDRIQRYIPKIALHCYVNRKQHEFLEILKTRLPSEKSIIANVDFGQNYTFLIQDSVQSYYWSPPQATIHPHALQYYHRDENATRDITYVVISDCLEHSALTFYCFHHEVMTEMKKLVDGLEKVYLVSDGSAAQYKGYKNFCNLLFHEKDYGVKAEHHFNVTAHGKSSCDAASGICKNNARQASKRGVKITTPFEFYEFCNKKLASDKLRFLYVSKERIDVIAAEMNLHERYKNAKPIPGSRSSHSFTPSAEWPNMIIKQFSSSDKSKEYSIFEGERSLEKCLPVEGEFVAFTIQNEMRIGRIIENDEATGDVKVFPLITGKTANTFRAKEFSVEIWIEKSTLLCIVRAPILTSTSGRFYKLDNEDYKKACSMFEERIQ